MTPPLELFVIHMMKDSQNIRFGEQSVRSYLCFALLFAVLAMFPASTLEADFLSDRSIRAVESVPEGVKLDHPNIPQTYDVWKEMIERADEKIRIGAFYFSSNQSLLADLLNRLEQKASEGVAVRIVIGSQFLQHFRKVANRLKETKGIRVRKYQLKPLLTGVMHAKYMVIDEERAYLGSANFDWRALKHIREIGLVYSTDHLVNRTIEVFRTDWKFAGLNQQERKNWERLQPSIQGVSAKPFPRPEGKQSTLVASAPAITPEGIMPSQEALIRVINGAKDELFMDVYKYTPWDYFNNKYSDRIDRAIRRAEARGVDIKMLVDKTMVDNEAEAYLKSLFMLDGIDVKVIKIPQSENGYIPHARLSHSKLVIADGELSWVGTTNLQWSYFTQSRNLDIVTWEKKTVSELRRFFLSGWESELSTRLDPTHDYRAPYRD